MRYNILIGGEAGQGPNILTQIIGEALVRNGNYVFYSRDYESLIRGGHNFNILTFSEEPVSSNDSKIDILVCLDNKTEEIHKKDLKPNGIILKNSKENMYYAGSIFKLLCLDFKLLEERLKKLKKNFSENMKNVKKGYEEETKNLCKLRKNIPDNIFMNGNHGISDGAVNSNLEIYYAYPMTPATPILNELASKGNIKVIELENEIAVINAAIGSSALGKNTMVGTSGGGFDLMTEALSMTGVAEIPVVVYLSQRPGPGTGVATYTSQGDLNLALNFGHGDFYRIVSAAGDPKEAQELINQAFYLSQKFKVPAIIIGDKHLAESFFTLPKNPLPSFIKIKNETQLIRYNSYEKDVNGSATENAGIIKANVERRLKKAEEIKKEIKNFSRFLISGKSNSQNIIVSWSSTKGAIIDAIKDLNCEFLQIKYLEPFPEDIKEKLLGKNILLIENSPRGQLAGVISKYTGIAIENKNKILRYDGRPFFADELKEEIKKRLK